MRSWLNKTELDVPWWLCVFKDSWPVFNHQNVVSVGKSFWEASGENSSALWVVGFCVSWLNLLMQSADWCWLGSRQTGPPVSLNDSIMWPALSHTTSPCSTHVSVFILPPLPSRSFLLSFSLLPHFLRSFLCFFFSPLLRRSSHPLLRLLFHSFLPIQPPPIPLLALLLCWHS